MECDSIIFDLDGTLWDACESVAQGWNIALNELGISKRVFEDWECYGNTNKPKSENIKAIVTRNSLSTPVYIGDTSGDQKAAIEASIPFIHAAYGFGRLAYKGKSVSTFKELVEMLSKSHSVRLSTQEKAQLR